MNTVIDDVDYGPLAQLLGKWRGVRGTDQALQPEGEERTAFLDELEFSTSGAACNADEQHLVAVRYHHIVRKKDNGLIFHDQIGHWIYEPSTGLVMHSLTIPRGVCVLAGGSIAQQDGKTTFTVSASSGSKAFGIVQSPFMLDNAVTKAFKMSLIVDADEMSYTETTQLHIYGKDFDHVDESRLQRLTYELD